MLTAFFATLHLIEEPMKHRKILLEHSVNLLTSAPLSSQSHSTITALINAQLTECSVLDLETLRDMLQGQLLDGANDGNRKRLGVLLAVLEVIGVRDPQRDDEDKSSTQSVTLSALYERSTSASCKTIAKLIREVNETTVLKKFISRTLRADETHELGKPLTWSRVAAALDVLDQDEFVAVLSGFTKHWDSHARDQLVNHVTGFTLLQSFFSSRPSYASAVIKFFKKHPHHIWDNMFSLVHLCVLCSVDRHATEVAGIMACAFGKFWSEGDLIRRGPWAQSMIRGNSTTNMRDNVTALLELMKASEAWFNLLGPALMRISMDIMLTCTTTKQGFGFTNGQQQTAGEVGSIAQSTFVEVALHNGRDLDHQLGRLIDAVFAFASNSSVAFLLVDVILEISRRGVAMLMNATEAFKKLVDDIWILPGDASVVLIRLLHPVISLRPELQHTLLEKLKSQLVRPSMVSTAVPILLLLWKTLIHLPSMANNPRLQARQSFATFSSQTPTNAGVVRRREELMTLEITGLVKRVFGQSPAAKHHVCGAMVEMGSKIPFFAIQALDFLLSHMKSLPPLAIDEYLERSENDVIAKHPVARLVKTVSALLRITMQQDDENTAVRELARSANETVENLLYEVASKSLEDLSLGGLAEHRASKHDQGTIVFGRTMVQLYDALIQHTWLMSGGEITYEESEILHKLLVLREELDRIPTETSRRKGPAKGPQGQISTAVFWMIDDCLDTDLPDLDLTLQALLGYTHARDA
ncbi:CBN-FNCI-1 protein [Aphelenchoides avenae]|nr:CBN-FNCI-1 protein [Aphelenchus avenae]